MCTSTKEMTVASWQNVGAIDLMNKAVPVVKPGEVLVRVAASGICGKLNIFLTFFFYLYINFFFFRY